MLDLFIVISPVALPVATTYKLVYFSFNDCQSLSSTLVWCSPPPDSLVPRGISRGLSDSCFR